MVTQSDSYELLQNVNVLGIDYNPRARETILGEASSNRTFVNTVSELANYGIFNRSEMEKLAEDDLLDDESIVRFLIRTGFFRNFQ